MKENDVSKCHPIRIFEYLMLGICFPPRLHCFGDGNMIPMNKAGMLGLEPLHRPGTLAASIAIYT